MKYFVLIVVLILSMSVVACSKSSNEKDERIKELESQIADLENKAEPESDIERTIKKVTQETEEKESLIENITDENTSDTNTTLYNAKIEEYRNALTMGEDSFRKKYTDDSSINTLMVGYAYSYGIPIEYTMYDVNKDGVDELLFSDGNSIIDIYTINGGKLIKLFADCYFGERSRLHVLDNGMLLSEGSGGASSESCELYRISETTAEVGAPVVAYYCDGNGPDPYSTGYTYMDMDGYSKELQELLQKSVFDKLQWTAVASVQEPIQTYDNSSEDTYGASESLPSSDDEWAISFYEIYGEWMNPFYGIWVGAFREESDAEKAAEELVKNNIDGQVYYTSDWSQLNPEPWYAITAGRYQSEDEAKKELSYVKKLYPSAYVKYSGEYIGPVE